MQIQKQFNTPFYYLGLGGLSIFVLALCVLQHFHITFFQIVPPCLFFTTTGFYCPGCGGTRAVVAMLQGHFLTSFLYHPVVLYTVIVYGWFLISQTIERLSHHRLSIGMNYRNIYLFTALFLIGIHWILENILLFF